MRLSTKLSGIVAIGGVAALGAGLISSGGIGAAFTDSATATADINVGSFGCELSSTDSSVTITTVNGVSTAVIDFGEITSSAAGSSTAPLTLTNTGSIPLQATWTRQYTGNLTSPPFTVVGPTINSPTVLAASATDDFNIGASWTGLDNTNLDQTGHMVWTVNCAEVPASAPSSPFTFDTSNGGSGSINSSGNALLNGPVQMFINAGAGAVLPPSEPTFSSSGTDAIIILTLSNGDEYYKFIGAGWADMNHAQAAVSWTDITNLGLAASTVSVALGGSGSETISCLNYGGSLIGTGTCS